jgi:tyrosinase
MSASNGPKVRYSVRYLQDEYDKGNTKPLEDLVRAWKGIQELPPTDKRSFFVLAGYHGEPFQYRRQVDALSDVDRYVYWGGYCNHGNVLFPTWHRVYVFKLEEALQSIVPDVTMPYWDETSEDSLNHGIPSILTQEKFELDGELIDNPLRSFVLPEALSDYLPRDDRYYEKPKGYETVRYPLSGLVGNTTLVL